MFRCKIYLFNQSTYIISTCSVSKEWQFSLFFMLHGRLGQRNFLSPLAIFLICCPLQPQRLNLLTGLLFIFSFHLVFLKSHHLILGCVLPDVGQRLCILSLIWMFSYKFRFLFRLLPITFLHPFSYPFVLVIFLSTRWL